MQSINGIKAILFDVDGTLFTSESIIGEIYRDRFHAFQKEHGRPANLPELDAIMAQIGKPVRKIFEALAPDLELEERETLSEAILVDLVRQIESGRGVHYDGVSKLLSTLHERGFQLFAASNGRLPYVRSILSANGSIDLFTAIPAIDNRTIFNKIDLVRSILDQFRIAPETAVLVGDRTPDREAAEAAGCRFIAARYGHGNAEEWGNAAAFIDRPLELLELLS